MDVHASGDHLIVGGYDRKLCWFDLELSSKPYKVMRYVWQLRFQNSHRTIAPQIPFPGDSVFAFPPHIPSFCLILRRRINTNIPFPGL